MRAKEVGYRDFGTLHEMLHALDDEDTDAKTDTDHEDAPQQKAPEKAPERSGPF